MQLIFLNNYMFTNREKDVLELLCKGYTNIEIGENLNISSHTAIANVASILRKLQVKNRLMAALKYRENTYSKERKV